MFDIFKVAFVVLLVLCVALAIVNGSVNKKIQDENFQKFRVIYLLPFYLSACKI